MTSTTSAAFDVSLEGGPGTAAVPGAPDAHIEEAVREVARRAKVAARVLAGATRATKDAALHAMADALVAAAP
ncbi:MAG: proA 1, partial [Actinotalea sp.]|nr:proA 1 [Actinotalea sp.]